MSVELPGLWHADFRCLTCGKVIDHHASVDKGDGMSTALLMADSVWIHRREDKWPCADGWDRDEWKWVPSEQPR